MLFALTTFLVGQTEKEVSGFDPNQLNDPEPNWPIILNPLLPTAPVKTEKPVEPIKDQLVSGFRVQVLATRYYKKADSLRVVLVKNYGTEVYIDFEAPNYKVRVGNFVTRNQAEKLQSELKSRGYENAWIIQTRVYAGKQVLK